MFSFKFTGPLVLFQIFFLLKLSLQDKTIQYATLEKSLDFPEPVSLSVNMGITDNL